MTGNITKLSGTYLNAQFGNNHSATVNAATTSFSNFLKSENSNVANSTSSNTQAQPASNDATDVKKDVQIESKSSLKEKCEDTKTGTKKAEDNSEKVATEAAEDVYAAVKEVTQVTDEVMAEAMAALGLDLIDLLDTANVKLVFEEINGIEAADLLINEELSTSLSDLLETVDEIFTDLLSELGMSAEEFDEVVSTIKNSEDPAIDIVNLDTVEENLKLNEAKASEESDPKVVVSDKKSYQEITDTTEKTEKTAKTVEDSVVVHTDKKSDTKQENEHMSFANTNQQNNFEFSTKVDEAVNLTSYVSETTREIVNQIVEQIKVNITNETTSMQMQLNPASLGHVGLTIESKAGSITASFVAQNEVVREAIESQIVELRENIEAQGIKVDAVEVTVAPHEFEQNLEQNQRGDTEDEKSKRVQGNGRRIRLNLSEEVEEEELSDEERITKEMMEENGNTVDYTV